MTMTSHAKRRMIERNIPDSLVAETVDRGIRKILPYRNAVEHRLKNVLGVRGLNLIVITGANGNVITSYVQKQKPR